MTNAVDPENLFGDIADYIEQAQVHLEEKNVEALTSLNNAVDDLSARLSQLAADVTADYAPEVDYLIEKMQILRDAMKQKQAGLTHDLEVMEKRLRALHAYHVPNSGA